MSKTKYTLKISTLTVLGLLCFVVTQVNAQELPFDGEASRSREYNPSVTYEQPTPSEQSDFNNEVKHEDTKIYPVRSAVKKEVPKQVKKNKPVEEKKTSTGPTPTYENANNDGSESVLSFNFLFYMIQKYKFTDVVDQ